MKVSSINISLEQQREENRTDVPGSHGSSESREREVLLPWGTERQAMEDNMFLPSRRTQDQDQGLASSFSQSAEIFQELQQECMRRLNVPTGRSTQPNPPSQTLQTQDGPQESVPSNEDKPQIPPRVPLPPRPVKRGDYDASHWSRDLSLSPPLADPPNDTSSQDQPPQIPPRDPLSQPGSRTPSPRGLVVGSPHPRVSVSPGAASYSSYLSTSLGKPMATTLSFASDPKYAAPKVAPAQKEPSSRGPCILPIVRDGRKISSTHYYLLPERPPYLHRYDRFFREAEAPEDPGQPANTATVRPMVAQQSQLKANFSSNNNSSLGLGPPRSGINTSLSLPRVCLDSPAAPTEGGVSSANRVQMVGSRTPRTSE